MGNKKINKLQELKLKARDEFNKANEQIDGLETDETEKEDKILSPKQILFVEEYVKNESGRDAAIKAGYAESSAHVQSHRLLQMPHIQSEIRKRYDLLSDKMMIKKIDIVKDLMEYNRKAMDGLISENAGLKALDLLNKMMGFYEAEKIQVESKQISINYVVPENNKD